MLRVLSAGESHGYCLTSIIEGMPAGLALQTADINRDLARRQIGYGRGKRMEIEQDEAEIASGVRFGRTLGSPISIIVKNHDWINWQDRMSVEQFQARSNMITMTSETFWSGQAPVKPLPVSQSAASAGNCSMSLASGF